MSASNWSHRSHAIRLILRRELRAMLTGVGLYLVLSFALLAALLFLRNYTDFIGENGLLILSGAFNFPLFSTIFLIATFLALSSVTTIARERDLGTMEVLFYGPMDAFSYVLGKYLAQIIIYLFVMLFFMGAFFLYVQRTGFEFSLNLGWVLLLSALTTSHIIAFGILLSALSGRVRTALLLFLSVVLLLVLIQFGQQLIAEISIQSRYYNPVLFLQNLLGSLNQGVRWLSPFSFLMQGMEAVRRGSQGSYLTVAAVSLLFTGLFLSLGVVALERRGVRK